MKHLVMAIVFFALAYAFHVGAVVCQSIADALAK